CSLELIPRDSGFFVRYNGSLLDKTETTKKRRTRRFSEVSSRSSFLRGLVSPRKNCAGYFGCFPSLTQKRWVLLRSKNSPSATSGEATNIWSVSVLVAATSNFSPILMTVTTPLSLARYRLPPAPIGEALKLSGWDKRCCW